MTDRRHRRPLPLGAEDGLPFSKGLMARALMGAGISTDRAYEIAIAAEQDIGASGSQAISLERLEQIAQGALGDEDGRNAMRRLRRFQDLYELDLPIILLVGGATGTGKSTVATDVAYRLGITRVTSTDFVRQTMRAFFSREFMPAIHYSSFEAGRAMADEDAEPSEAVLDGFLEQTRDVLVGVTAAIDRALQEGWSMVLEGVHLVPGCCRARFRARSSSSACSRSTTPRRTRATSGSATRTPRERGPTRSTWRRSTTSGSFRTTFSAVRNGTACTWSRTPRSRVRSSR